MAKDEECHESTWPDQYVSQISEGFLPALSMEFETWSHQNNSLEWNGMVSYGTHSKHACITMSWSQRNSIDHSDLLLE